MSSACQYAGKFPKKKQNKKGSVKKLSRLSSNAEDFLRRLEEKQKKDWEDYVFGLIRNGDPKIVSYISDNCFVAPAGKTLSFDRAKRIVDLSSRIPVRLKKKLKTILQVCSPELARALENDGFSFDFESFRGS